MNLLSALSFNTFSHPWALLLLLVVPVLFVAECLARPSATLTVSTGEMLARRRSGRGALLRHVPAALRAFGLTMLIVAVARPLRGIEPRKERADVIDIMLCVDVSGSMRAMDFVAGDQPVDRLYVTKQAVRHFLENRKFRPGDRYGLDRVGLVFFGAYAVTQCPLTLDYGILEREIDLAEIDERDPRAQRTAIGSAIGLAVSRLRKSEAKAKVIVLLTDGQNNAGELDPITAAQLAKEYGIRIYTIGAGASDEVLIPRRSIFGGQIMVPEVIPIDVETLQRIASTTGGKFYRATDTASLQKAYDEINRLETTRIEIDDYYRHEEGFLPFAVAGAIAMASSVFSRRIWFDPIP